MPRLSLVSIFTRPQSFIFVMIPLLFFVSVLLLLSRSPVSSIATSSKPVIPAQPSHPSLATTAKPPLPSEPLSPPSSSPLSAAPAFNERQTAVRDAFRRAWAAYKKHCWGQDELRPVSKQCHSWGGFGLTIVDALDTAIIMGLKEEVEEGLEWIEHSLVLTQPADVSVFETTIRMLGGLLSIYSMTNKPFVLEKAQQLGDLLLPAFETSSGLPHSTINLKSGRAYSAAHLGQSVALSEVGTLSMEFNYLSHLTKDMKYAKKVARVTSVLAALPRQDGIYSCHVNRDTGAWGGQSRSTLGALGDSYYEYLLKMWLLAKRQVPLYQKLYDEAAKGILQHMIGHSSDRPPLTYIAELMNRVAPFEQIPKMDHLVCFASGMFALGASANPDDWLGHMSYAEEVGDTCVQMYVRQEQGVAPEIVKFTAERGMYIDVRDKHYLLRPETVEALFVLWRTTAKEKWRDAGWRIFEAINRSCSVYRDDEFHGFSGLRDVTVKGQPAFDDMQQSFFLAETLKYLYLLFSPNDLIPLDKYVFNTEAHPLPVFQPSAEHLSVLSAL